MPGQVDQDVDALLPDTIGKFGFRQPGDHLPMRKPGPQALCDVVFDDVVRVGIELDIL